jgi:hypothetical protein
MAIIFLVEGIIESDITGHLVDDWIIAAAAAVALGNYAATRKYSLETTLAKANRLALIVAIVVILAGLLAVTQEYTDVMDFGDDPPTIILGVVLLISGMESRSTGGVGSAGTGTMKDSSRRRASTYVFAFIFLTGVDLFVYDWGYGLGVTTAIGDMLPFAVPGLAALVVVLATRKGEEKTTRRANEVLAALGVALIIAGLVSGGPPEVFFGAAMLGNRFL